MRKTQAALAAALCFASAPASSADVEAGRVRAEACQACHGVQGVSENPTVPSLAGQSDRYLQWQLVFFRSGRRANEIMGPLAAELSDGDIRNLGAYFASLPRPGAPPGADDEPALRARGEQVAGEHRCAACHGDTFGGKQAAPAIKHQPRAYLAKALGDYRASARPSVGVAAMTEAASGLSDDDIQALARFLETYE